MYQMLSKKESKQRQKESKSTVSNLQKQQTPLRQFKIQKSNLQRQQQLDKTAIVPPINAKYKTLSDDLIDDVRVHYNTRHPIQFQDFVGTRRDETFIGPSQRKRLEYGPDQIIPQRIRKIEPTEKLYDVPLNTSRPLETEANALLSKQTDNQSTYSIAHISSNNDVIQGQFKIKEMEFENFENFAEVIQENEQYLELIKAIENGHEIFMSYAKELFIADAPPPSNDGLTYEEIVLEEELMNDENLYKSSSTNLLIGVFENVEEFVQYLYNYTKCMLSHTDEQDIVTLEEDELQIQVTRDDYSTSFVGGNARFPTIYSYGMAANTTQIDSNQQGPHTLAHVSVDYLMNRAPLEYNFAEQIIDPERVSEILVALEVNMESPKIERYYNDYVWKFNELYCAKERGAAVARELMEMHPMAVYSWRGNVNALPNLRGRPTSKDARKGKGEKYSNKITLDNGWKPLGIGKDELINQPIYSQMEEYLGRRLSMAVCEEKIEEIVSELIANGEYTLEKEDMLDPDRFNDGNSPTE